jgi:hypothetical protein
MLRATDKMVYAALKFSLPHLPARKSLLRTRPFTYVKPLCLVPDDERSCLSLLSRRG